MEDCNSSCLGHCAQMRAWAYALQPSDGPGLLRHLTHHSDSPSEASTAWRTEMCSRTEATLRLIGAWLDRAVDDPDFPYRVTVADMLTEDNIAIVSEMD